MNKILLARHKLGKGVSTRPESVYQSLLVRER